MRISTNGRFARSSLGAHLTAHSLDGHIQRTTQDAILVSNSPRDVLTTTFERLGPHPVSSSGLASMNDDCRIMASYQLRRLRS